MINGPGDPLNTTRSAADAFGQLGDDVVGFDPEELEDGVESDDSAADPAPDDQLGDDDDAADTTAESDDTAGADEPGETDEDAPQLRTFDEVAEAFGVTVADLDNLELTLPGENGANEVVTFSELKKGRMRDADYRRQSQQLAESVRQNEQTFMAQRQQLDHQALAVGGVLNTLKQQIAAAANSPQMQELRARDAGEWTARTQEFQQQAAQIDQLYANVAAGFQQRQQQQAAENQQRQAQLANEERALLMQRLPEFNAELDGKISSFLSSEFGFTPEEITGTIDHRHILIANMARLYLESQKGAAVVSQKLRKAPAKRVAPSKPAGKTGGRGKHGSVAKAKRKARNSGSVKDAAAAFGEIFKDHKDF